MTETPKGSLPTGAKTSGLAEALTAAVIATWGGFVIYDSLRLGIGWVSDGPQPGYFSFYIGLLMALASLAIGLRALARISTKAIGPMPWGELRALAGIFLPTLLLVAATPYAGIYLASAIYLTGFARLRGGLGWLAAIALGVAASVGFFLVFEIWFDIPLPKGPLETALGY
jgi:putative tricarboxylic transport membrane protein